MLVVHLFSRLRMRAPRWPSTDYRDYLTVSPPAQDRRVTLKNVVLLELHGTYVSFDGRPGGSEELGLGGEESQWMLTLTMN